MGEYRTAISPPAAVNPERCMVPACKGGVRIWFGNVLGPSVQAAVFGSDFHEDMLATCQKHYNILKRRDGIDLGYRKVNGILRAYVKNEGF